MCSAKDGEINNHFDVLAPQSFILYVDSRNKELINGIVYKNVINL